MTEISQAPMEGTLAYSRAVGSGLLSYSACLFLEIESVPGAKTDRTGSLGVGHSGNGRRKKAQTGGDVNLC